MGNLSSSGVVCADCEANIDRMVVNDGRSIYDIQKLVGEALQLKSQNDIPRETLQAVFNYFVKLHIRHLETTKFYLQKAKDCLLPGDSGDIDVAVDESAAYLKTLEVINYIMNGETCEELNKRRDSAMGNKK